MRVQVDAFRSAPAKYMQAVLWRARRLRLRSRNRIAALAGSSPHAYDLWIAREEAKAAAAYLPTENPTMLEILPVIDCRGGSRGVQVTIASVEAAGTRLEPVRIGSASDVKSLARQIPPDGQLWLCLIKPGDMLAPDALRIYAAEASRQPNATLIYADDDLIDDAGRRRAPHFKPDWNPDLYEHHDFVCGSSIVRVSREVLADLDHDAGADEFVPRALSRGKGPVHIPLVLHHRKKRPEPVLPPKPADVTPDPAPLITAVIPTRNQLELLRKCVDGLRIATYPRVQTIIVDNASDDEATLAYLAGLEAEGVTVLRSPGPFNFSRLNNLAVDHAEGELLCFLNNDVEMLDRDWLSLLVRHALRPEIGAVGARLLYADRTVQHAGVFIGIGGGAGHAHRLQQENETGYFKRARLPQRVTAVTAACLVVDRAKFLAVGGFDEVEFPVAFNDVDLCLKLNEKGWESFYEPRATLIHHESKSRGSDSSKRNRARFARELAALKRRWHTDTRRDPYHHPHLSPFTEQFLISV